MGMKRQKSPSQCIHFDNYGFVSWLPFMGMVMAIEESLSPFPFPISISSASISSILEIASPFTCVLFMTSGISSTLFSMVSLCFPQRTE